MKKTILVMMVSLILSGCGIPYNPIHGSTFYGPQLVPQDYPVVTYIGRGQFVNSVYTPWMAISRFEVNDPNGKALVNGATTLEITEQGTAYFLLDTSASDPGDAFSVTISDAYDSWVLQFEVF